MFYVVYSLYQILCTFIMLIFVGVKAQRTLGLLSCDIPTSNKFLFDLNRVSA